MDKSIRIGESDLIDIDCIDQSVEIDNTLVLIFTDFIDLYRKYISPSAHKKIKTEFMKTVNLSTIDLQLRSRRIKQLHSLSLKKMLSFV